MENTKEGIIQVWKEFAKIQKENDRFILNPDKKIVEILSEGVLNNEKKFGLKFCPCRIPIGDKEKDAALICPCNFKSQECWKKEGRCWCSLFIRP